LVYYEALHTKRVAVVTKENSLTSKPELATFLQGKMPSEVVEFTLEILMAHYRRKIKNAEAQLAALENFDRKELEAFWNDLQAATPTAEALRIFTNWLEGKVDGDGL
jgi:hypothetical protein